mmetsp:Transcript_337/g.568  ORF Transcript_337/g.568 Transcript_337/m.568 type:complete len:83 (-) Transcript_337:9-257(-)
MMSRTKILVFSILSNNRISRCDYDTSYLIGLDRNEEDTKKTQDRFHLKVKSIDVNLTELLFARGWDNVAVKYTSSIKRKHTK